LLTFDISTDPVLPFSNTWFRERYPDLPCGKDSKKGSRLHGWYWIATDLSNSDLQGAEVELPTEERKNRGNGKYVSIGERATETCSNLGGNVCAVKLNKLRVVYNGHEGWARGRLRGHYKSLDPRTGALRISQHPNLHKIGKWGAAIFTEDMIHNLSPSLQPLASHLIATKLGRTVVEME